MSDDRSVPAMAAGVRASAARPSEIAAAAPPTEPWSPRDLTRMLGTTGVGLVAVGVAWFGSGGTTNQSHEVLWTILAAAGVLVVGLGQGMFVLDAFRAIRPRRLAVMTDVAALVPASADAARRTGLPRSDDTRWDADLRVASDAMSHYHRPGCPLAAGKAVPIQGTAAEHEAMGRRACGVCGA